MKLQLIVSISLIILSILVRVQNIVAVDIETHLNNIELFDEYSTPKKINPKENLTNYNPIQRILRRIAY